MRAGSIAKRIDDGVLRKQLTGKLTKIETALAKRAPKRGTSVVAFDEASHLVAKYVTNREARKLLESLKKVCN